MKLVVAVVETPGGTEELRSEPYDRKVLTLQEDGWVRIDWRGGLPQLIPPHRVYSVFGDERDA